ncbi:hypothetical protein LTR56_013212 [Elasticomyces elasticus]|nr:hypothetical protein LTR56_013212 [Elasticomyces elasticus]KAK3650069.1 hypothetical protein LTR22_012664 [Elasticomyces elasticus]KAK4920096.1 hypothetical protein LTR49_012357 [Elasticomyces elasticus]KAK5757180.1 hypothetical protein LTS12_012696 [Elasticomyces elasticus]
MSSPRRSRRKSESYYQLTSTPRQDQAQIQGQAQGQNTMDVTVRVRTSASPVPTEAGQQDSQCSPSGKSKSRPRPHSRRSRHSQGSLGTLEPVREDEDDASCVSSSGLLVHKEAKMLRRKPLPAPPLPSPPAADEHLSGEIDRMVERNRKRFGPVGGARSRPSLDFQSYDGSNSSAVYSASVGSRSSGSETRVSYPSPLDSTSGHFSPVSRPDWAGMAGMPLPNMPYISLPAENPNTMRRGGLMSTIPPKFKPPTWSPETGPLMGVVQKPDPTAMPPRLRSDVSGSLVPTHAFGGFQGQWTDAPRKLGEGTRPMPVLIDWWEPENRQQLQRTKEKRRFWRRGGSETAVSVKVGGPMHHGPVVGQGKERQPSTAVSESVLDSPLQRKAVAGNMLDGQRPQTTQEVRPATDFSGRKPLRYRQSAPQIRNGVSTTSVSVRASFASDRPTPSLNSAEISPISTHSRSLRNGSGTSSLLLHSRASIAGADRSRAKMIISPTPSLDDTYTRLRMLEATCQRFNSVMFSSNTPHYMADTLWSCMSKRRELCCQAERLQHRAKELREHASMGIEQDGYRATLYKLAWDVEDLEDDVKWAVVGLNELDQGHATAVGIRRVQPGEVKVVDVVRRPRPVEAVEVKTVPPLKEEVRVLKPKKSLFSLFSWKKEGRDKSVSF